MAGEHSAACSLVPGDISVEAWWPPSDALSQQQRINRKMEFYPARYQLSDRLWKRDAIIYSISHVRPILRAQ